MLGYVNDMKKTICAYDEDGWFKSGDVGYYTDDCCLFIVGRIKELMIYKDQRVRYSNRISFETPAQLHTIKIYNRFVFRQYDNIIKTFIDCTDRHRNRFIKSSCRTGCRSDGKVQCGRRFVDRSCQSQTGSKSRTRPTLIVCQWWDGYTVMNDIINMSHRNVFNLWLLFFGNIFFRQGERPRETARWYNIRRRRA